ncbi:hypothetical protein [Streptomyces sp. NPDC060031]|uniref:hypothetical protein n=1 Tax=Streptomyces sp. NPDC060031 TaxID=3347043 RepID=UPI003675E485
MPVEEGGQVPAAASRAGGRVGVVAPVGGEGAGEPGVDVRLYVRPGAAGELVADRFVAFPGFGLLQRAQLAQRLELVGAGRDPGGFAQVRFPGGGRGIGGELGLNDRRDGVPWSGVPDLG